jgi:hypothetical protein
VAALWVGSTLLIAPASGAVLSASIDPDLYGDLDQNDPNVMNGGCACGPTSVTNSFVYLQNAAPNVYAGPNGRGKGLVNYAGASPTQAEQAAVANILGDAMHMNSAGGTFIEDFIFGKRKYLEDRFPGKTRYAAQINFEWRAGAPTSSMIAKPDFVQDDTAPTLEFIYEQIRDGEDVEIFVARGGEHYLTVTGISYDDTTNMGTLDIIDPLGGAADTVDIEGLTTIGAKMFIELDYELTAGTNVVVAHAVSESPIPEPAAIALLVIGLIGLCAFRQRRTV